MAALWLYLAVIFLATEGVFLIGYKLLFFLPLFIILILVLIFPILMLLNYRKEMEREYTRVFEGRK